jgi:hypothetical protein
MPVAVAGRSRHSQSRPARSKVTTLQSKGSSMAWRWSLEDGCGGKMYSWFMNIYKYIYIHVYIYIYTYVYVYVYVYVYIYKYIYITHTYVFMCIHMYSYVFICIHMNSYEFICIHDLREEGKHAILCHHPSSLQTPTRYHPISGITQKKQIPSTPSNQPPFHPSNSHYGKRLSTYHSNLQAYTNEPWPVSHHEHPLSH